MKETISTWFAAFVVVLSPLIPLIILVFVASLFDAITFKMALKKEGKIEIFNRGKYWCGILWKTLLYTFLIGGAFLVEITIGKDLLNYFDAEKWYLLPTRIVATIVVWHEVKSIDKNYTTAKGVSFIKQAKKYVKDLISLKSNIEENIKR